MSAATAVVVGAGVLGTCVADRLAGDGWAVTLVDQAPPGHVRGTSSGDTRIIRASHGPAEWYAASARRARERWLALQDELGVPLIEEPGVVWLAQRRDGIEAESEAALRGLGIPVERVDPAEVLPGCSADGLAFALLEPEAGYLRARQAVRAIAARAVRERGVRARFDAWAAPLDDGAVALDDGTVLDGDLVVWAPGPWLGRIFPELVQLRVLRRDHGYLAVPPEWRSPPAPVWIDYDAAVYGVGDVDGAGAKIASDFGEIDFDPSTGRRDVDVAAERRFRSYLRLRFPALAEAPLLGWATCQYELTADTEFILARHPEHERVVLLGGGSGHAFKHGPALADLVAAGGPFDPRFGLGARSAGRPSLITAGENL